MLPDSFTEKIAWSPWVFLRSMCPQAFTAKLLNLVNQQDTTQEAGMQLGNFSVSLAVKDIDASKLFYQKLGFEVFAGDASHNWLIMKNGEANIGLFQGMFDQNILTFNPGWSNDAQPLDEFTDIRELQSRLKERGITLVSEADENSSGPANFMIADPDGNMILVDQHV